MISQTEDVQDKRRRRLPDRVRWATASSSSGRPASFWVS